MELPVVLPVKPNEDAVKIEIHEHLPQAPSLVLIFGSVRSGKSNYVSNMILNPSFMRGKLDKIILISPSARNDDSMRFVIEDDNVELIEEYDDEWLKALLEYQREVPVEERQRLMLIADDALHYIKRVGKGSGLSYLATRYRHSWIFYYVIVAQAYKVLDPKIRTNAGAIIVMKLPNLKTLKDMDEELGGFLNNQFMKLYVYCIFDQPFSFMYIDMKQNPPKVYLRHEVCIFQGSWLIPEPNVDMNSILRAEEMNNNQTKPPLEKKEKESDEK